VTTAFGANMAEHVAPQLMPEGVLVTVRVPDFETVRREKEPNVAVTDLASLIVRVHVPVPLHAPDHPVKEEF
jgi:hypothetical protein